MIDKFTSWVKDTATSLKNEVTRYKNKTFLEATVAGCVLVASADGHISAEEKQKMIGFMKLSDALKVFDTEDVIALFNKYADTVEFDMHIGKGECLKVIAKIKKDESASRLLIRVCCAIGAADGNFDDNEKAVVREICAELGLNPADFFL